MFQFNNKLHMEWRSVRLLSIFFTDSNDTWQMLFVEFNSNYQKVMVPMKWKKEKKNYEHLIDLFSFQLMFNSHRFGDKWFPMVAGKRSKEDSLQLEFSKATSVRIVIQTIFIWNVSYFNCQKWRDYCLFIIL